MRHLYHLRILGASVLAAFAVGAVSLAVAGPAFAKCTGTCAQEKQEAKNAKALTKWEAKRVGDPFNINSWAQFRACQLERHANFYETCYAGVTTGGKTGGFFEIGKVNVPLSKSIILSSGFEGAGEEIKVVPAGNGQETLNAPELPVTNGLKVITKSVQEQAEWPAALTESYNAALKNKEGAVNVKIEMAGNGCYEELGCIDTFNLLAEKGPAFKLPLKVKVSSPWLTTLESGPCYIGSDEHPIHINLTTEGAGTPGHVAFNEEFTKIQIKESKLVDTHWTIEPESLPQGCGGAYSSYIDKALGLVLNDGSPTRTGIVVLKGDLYTSEVEGVEYTKNEGLTKEL